MNNEKHENDLHNATPERLAEMIEEHNRWRRGEKPYDKIGVEMPFNAHQLGLILEEAARRLRETTKPTYHDEQFN